MVSSLFNSYERDMAQLLRQLRGTPAMILWRSYAPTHFGGSSGAYVSGQETQARPYPCLSVPRLVGSAMHHIHASSTNDRSYIEDHARLSSLPIKQGPCVCLNVAVGSEWKMPSLENLVSGRGSVSRLKKGRSGMTNQSRII